MKSILITGATSGIGLSCAKLFHSRGYEIIITGRSPEKLADATDQIILESGDKIKSILMDVRNRKEVISRLSGLKVDVLINNAGLALGLDPVHSGNIDHWEEMIDTNIKGLLYVTRTILPGMIEAGSGHIINISSIAGREIYPNGNVYCATKAAVDVISRSMRMELVSKNIKVSTVSPGAVVTNFSKTRFEGDLNRAEKVYEGLYPLTAEDVAIAVMQIIEFPIAGTVSDIELLAGGQGGTRDYFRG